MQLKNEGEAVTAKQQLGRTAYCLVGVLLTFHAAVADDIAFLRHENMLMLHCGSVAERLNYEFKIVAQDRLVTFCTEGETEVCIPVRLNAENSRTKDGSLFVSAETLAKALRISINDKGTTVALTPLQNDVTSPEVVSPEGYKAAWPKGRGFRVGDTLPDIPLVDLAGEEVRFSRFLGKRYILYCWASW